MDTTNDSEKFRPKFKSEFSMGELDFKEFALWQSRANLSSSIIQSCEVPDLAVIQRYFSELNVLYKLWKPLISSVSLREEFNKIKKEARNMKRAWEQSVVNGLEVNKNFVFKLSDLLDEFHERLFEIKQIIGLGIVVKRSFTTKQKIKYGIRPRTEFADLPEA